MFADMETFNAINFGINDSELALQWDGPSMDLGYRVLDRIFEKCGRI